MPSSLKRAQDEVNEEGAVETSALGETGSKWDDHQRQLRPRSRVTEAHQRSHVYYGWQNQRSGVAKVLWSPEDHDMVSDIKH